MAKAGGKGKAAGGAAGKARSAGHEVFGFPVGAGWLRGASGGKSEKGKRSGRVLVLGFGAPDLAKQAEAAELPAWLKERAEKRRGELLTATTDDGPLWIVAPAKKPAPGHHAGQLDTSAYGAFRDLAGVLGAVQTDHALDALAVRFVQTTDDEAAGFLVGLALGAYRYKAVRTQRGDGAKLPELALDGVDDDVVERAAQLAESVNLARHLVNVPSSELNPKTFSDAIVALFKGKAGVTVDVITGAKLAAEKCGMLIAVGQGAAHGPALVHVSYRPKSAKGKKPLAFVGKGITFDSGGLDLKDAASMRLMKKDMGGSASVVGLAHWAVASAYGAPLDFYLALAENAVDERSFRPGDVLTARNGTTVEIDNTDAEGRLVLGDALDYAVKREGGDQPSAVINLATLTGAMRIALGVRLAGMFATDDGLADGLLKAAQRRGDPAWRMPLVAEYINQLKSNVADLANSGPGRFGGAVTAALFLQRFVGTTPWAHFDMYAWTDPGVGGCTETGGNGQCIQLLADYLESLV